MILAGKPGASVVTTGGTDDKELHGFLAGLMGCLGIKPVASLSAVCFVPGAFLNREAAEYRAEEVAGIIYPYVSGEKQVESDEHMEQCFRTIKSKITSGKKWLAGYKPLEPYRFGIEDEYRLQEHVLDEDKERLISYFATFANTPFTSYNDLSISDIDYNSAVLSSGDTLVISF